MGRDGELTYRKIFYLWVPLAATWLMMSVEGPFLAAVIARLAEPKYNLAAYGVAFSFATIIEAPIIMMLSASTALAKDRESFYRLRSFTYGLNALLTAAMISILVTPAFELVTRRWIGLPEPVARLTYSALVVLLPWPGAIGYRRFYQGLLIRYDMSRRVAYGTVVRLSTMTTTALVLYGFARIDGVIVGAAALSAGVTAEALASRFMVASIVRRLRQTQRAEAAGGYGEGSSAWEPLTYGRIARFYIPLALTSTIALAVYPMITFFLGHGRMALQSLVVFPVVNASGFIFRSLGLSYQEVGIALLGGKRQNFVPLRNFATVLGAAASLGLSLIAFTPLSHLWFHSVSGLSVELSDFAVRPLQVLTLTPALTVLLCFQRSILVHGGRTRPITWTAMIEVATIGVVLLVGIRLLDGVGAVVAAAAVLFGRLAATVYLVPPCWRLLRHVQS